MSSNVCGLPLFFYWTFFFTGHYWTLLTVESRGTLKQKSATVRVFSEYFI